MSTLLTQRVFLMAYSPKALELRQCKAVTVTGEPCRHFAMWDHPQQLCRSHIGKPNRRRENRFDPPFPHVKSAARCDCTAYPFPHRPGGGLCQWPDEPNPLRLKIRDVVRQICQQGERVYLGGGPSGLV